MINIIVKMKFEVNKHSQNFGGPGACNRVFIQFLIETKQVGFSREGNNYDHVNVKLHLIKLEMHHPRTDVTFH
jgi:hypothetical protein